MASGKTPSVFTPLKKKLASINGQGVIKSRTFAEPAFNGASIKSAGRRSSEKKLLELSVQPVQKSDGVKAGLVAKVLAEHLPNIADFEARKAMILSVLPK